MKKFILLLLLYSLPLFSQEDRSRYNGYFEQAAQEFLVPADILRGIAFAETRWSHLQWEEGDTANPCNGMPRPYGIMSLWDNQFFGHSLKDAANLLGVEPRVLKEDAYQNIRGAAVLLRVKYDALPKTEGTEISDLENWSNAVAAYSGIPQQEIAAKHSVDVYEHLAKGSHEYGIEMNAVPIKKIDAVRASYQKIVEREESIKPRQMQKSANTPDYPFALWASAYSGHWYTTGYGRYFVIIHDMEGYYLSTISYFQMSGTSASAHYCINSGNQANGRPAGEVTQMVEEQYWGWHALCWNRYSIGIEHEGFSNNAAWYTDAMYQSSADLVEYLCNKYSIPKDRNHIIAHQEGQNNNWPDWVNSSFNPVVSPDMDPECNTHSDPGPNWKWDYFMTLVNGDSTTIGFEDVTLSKWYSGPTISGSTFGVSKLSSFTQSSVQKYQGTYSGKLSLIDSSQSNTWFARQYFSGSIDKSPDGYVRVRLRASSVPGGLQVRLAFDDNSNTATEASSWKNVTADGTWHIYEWNLDDAAQWFGWVGSYNGQLDGPTVNFDSFQFQCSDPNSAAAQYDIYIDDFEISPNSALPVELMSFTASNNGDHIELQWKTATEVNNYGFEIERRAAGGLHLQGGAHLAWGTIGFVEGNGISNTPKEYSFSDKDLKEGKYSYRLKQIDRNGMFEYSQEIEVSVGLVPKEFSLSQNYPNPFNPATMLGFTLQVSGMTTLKVYDAIGREVATLVNEHLEAGLYHQRIFDASNLGSGIYFARLSSNRQQLMKKMVLLR